MKNLRKLKPLVEPKRLTNSTAALAGLASGISVLVGLIAAHAAPHGWLRIRTALHLSKAPIVVKLAPFIAGVAITIATAAGLMKFYSWCIEHEEVEREDVEHQED